MFKNVLIISDNVGLCEKFDCITNQEKFKEIKFTFSTSPFSNKKQFEDRLKKNVCVFDLKNANDVRSIIADYDLIFSIHCKQIFPIELVNSIKCINVHPGYNPINRGWYPQVFSIINNLPIGATIHEIDEKLDHGKIIAREFVKKEIFDTSESLYNKIILKEIELLEENLENIINNNYSSIIPETEGNLYLKKEFNNLLEINLNEKMECIQFINKLRALTHGNFNNAFFIDPESGRKIYISVNLRPCDE